MPSLEKAFLNNNVPPATLWKLYNYSANYKGDDANAAAPSLGGVVGRVAGAGTAFPYSNALKKSNLEWTPKHLFAYIKAPGKYIPGNKMSFAGIKNPKEIADLIAYLEKA